MAQTKQVQKDIVKRLSASGDEAIQRLAELPGGTRLLEAGNALRDRLEDVSKRLRSIDALEKRVAELEQRVDKLSKPARKTTTARKSTTARKPAVKKSA